MQWKGRRQSTNVSDQRGSGGGFGGGGMRIPVRAGGGGGIGLLIIMAILWLGFGINPLALLGMDQGGGGNQSQVARGPGPQGTADETDDFVATVLADTEDVWNRRFSDAGETYPEPTLVMFSGSVSSACGQAGAATGPFYCPADQKVYIDLSFFRQLAGQLNSPGDFAQAYVIAHEVGHHVQDELGITAKVDGMRRRLSQSQNNAMSVRVELKADCFAGIWAHHSQESKKWLDPGDIEAAMNAAQKIGDDALQRSAGRAVVPDSFTHGTSAQRQRWFGTGYQTGSVQACDTFNARNL